MVYHDRQFSKKESTMQRTIIFALLGSVAFMGALHLSVPLTETDPTLALGLYVAVAAVGLLWSLLIHVMVSQPAGEPTFFNRIRHTVGVGMRNGILLGAAYVVMRLAIFTRGEPQDFLSVASYAAGVAILFSLGMGLIGGLIGLLQPQGSF
jgi:hypothetical protein